jgi:hypothetical protein
MENRQWKTGQVVHCSVVGCRLLIFHWLGDGDLRFTPAPRQGGLREMQNGQPTMKNGLMDLIVRFSVVGFSFYISSFVQCRA